MANNTMESGRHFKSSPKAKSQMPPIGGPKGPATSGFKPANSRQAQGQDSGGGTFQPVRKPIAGINGKSVKFYGK